MKLIRFDNEITFIDSQGTPHNAIVGDHLTEDDFRTLYQDYRNGTLKEDDILLFVYPELAEKRRLEEAINYLVRTGHFNVDKGAIYRENIPISLPELLVKHYYDAYENVDTEYITALDNFWTLCALNPDPQARHDLFPFLQRFGMIITKKGYILLYRNVDVKKEGDVDLHNFVNTEYYRIKRIKKSPKTYWVVEQDGLHTSITENAYFNNNYEGRIVGTVEDLYDNPTWTQTIYTDRHTGKTEIKLKEPVSMPRSKCDPNPLNECSTGYHGASAQWLEKNYYGHQGMAILVNPMNVTAVPHRSSYGKMRFCEYYPMCLVDWDDEGKIITPDTVVFENDYTDYVQSELQKMLKEADVQEFKVNSFQFTGKEFSALSTSIEQVQLKVSNRISSITKYCEKCGTELSAYEALAGICEQCYNKEE